jgi:hypothetical protein
VQGLIPDQCCQIAEISVAELEREGQMKTRAMDKHESRIVLLNEEQGEAEKA